MRFATLLKLGLLVAATTGASPAACRFPTSTTCRLHLFFTVS
jgi:hypothetical protein